MPTWNEAYNPNIKAAASKSAATIKRAVFSKEDLYSSSNQGPRYLQYALKDFGTFAENAVGRYSAYKIEKIEVDVIPGRQAFNVVVPWMGFFAPDTTKSTVTPTADIVIADMDMQTINLLNSDIITISWKPAVNTDAFPLEGNDAWINKFRTDVLHSGLKMFTDPAPDATLSFTLNTRIYVAMKQTPE